MNDERWKILQLILGGIYPNAQMLCLVQAGYRHKVNESSRWTYIFRMHNIKSGRCVWRHSKMESIPSFTDWFCPVFRSLVSQLYLSATNWVQSSQIPSIPTWI